MNENHKMILLIRQQFGLHCSMEIHDPITFLLLLYSHALLLVWKVAISSQLVFLLLILSPYILLSTQKWEILLKSKSALITPVLKTPMACHLTQNKIQSPCMIHPTHPPITALKFISYCSPFIHSAPATGPPGPCGWSRVNKGRAIGNEFLFSRLTIPLLFNLLEVSTFSLKLCVFLSHFPLAICSPSSQKPFFCLSAEVILYF